MKTIKVVIGMIFKGDKFLLSTRPNGTFMEGFWEFAGGKIEEGESEIEALKREFDEELGIQVEDAKFLRNITQIYPTKNINLSVFIIKKYSGEIIPQEGQQMKWVSLKELDNYKLLPTVKPLLNFATLPKIYWITPKIDDDFMEILATKIASGIKLIQLRSKVDLEVSLIEKVYKICQKNQVKLMLNIPNSTSDFNKYCNGYHLTGDELKNTTIKTHKFMSASTHTFEEVQKCEKLGFDFVVISPVNWTKSHLEAVPIGFEKAGEIAKNTQIPVYFLGGMSNKDLPTALENGGVGIAGITVN
jgi:8-oxo-dGTP diphosphatase